ncbi:MAG TPA: cytochrome c maturation protein CcmE [Thermoanaerobaculia bacterium]|jgi:cytochrome c-type biogenesis protein CcmE
MKKGYLIATALALGFVALGLTAFRSTLTPYLTFDEARHSDGVVQVMGGLDKESVRYDAAGGRLLFSLVDETGGRMPVSYPGTRPANFQDAISIVAIGRHTEGRIEAERLLVKCPSKYQGAEVKEYPAANAAPSGPRT